MFLDPAVAEMEGGQSSRPPQQISDMLQKFAQAFKAKTYELFAEDSDAADDNLTFLLDCAEEFIPYQKVVVIKPDSKDSGDGILRRALIPSLFTAVSAFEASYLQFQAAHVPRIDQNAIAQADVSIVSIFQKLNEMKSFYNNSGLNCSGFDFPARSFLEFQVQENQSKLRVLETIANSLQSQIDAKDEEVRNLRRKLDQIRVSCTDLQNQGSAAGSSGVGCFLTIGVFEAILGDAVKSVRRFTKLLIDLMNNAGWDLENVSKYIHSGVCYAKQGHWRYAYLSYICMGMFQSFDTDDFGLSTDESICKNIKNSSAIDFHWRQLVEHISTNPMEILKKNPNCEFLQFCQRKYEELIHPTMESSIFSGLDRKDKVLESWKLMRLFFEAFVRMASSVWLLHKLAYLFDPKVEIFRVEKGEGFSMVYMEDGSRRRCSGDVGGKTRGRVGFSVAPGFKVGRTVIQSQVYLSN